MGNKRAHQIRPWTCSWRDALRFAAFLSCLAHFITVTGSRNITCIMVIENGGWLSNVEKELEALNVTSIIPFPIKVIDEGDFYGFTQNVTQSWNILIDLTDRIVVSPQQLNMSTREHWFTADRLGQRSALLNSSILLALSPIIFDYTSSLMDTEFIHGHLVDKVILLYDVTAIDSGHVVQKIAENTSFLLLEVSNDTDVIYEVLKHATVEPEPIDFVIYATADVANLILKKASEMALFQNHHKWIVFTLDAQHLSCVYAGADNLIVLQLKPSEYNDGQMTVQESTVMQILKLLNTSLTRANIEKYVNIPEARQDMFGYVLTTCMEMDGCTLTPDNGSIVISAELDIVKLSTTDNGDCAASIVGQWSSEEGATYTSKLFPQFTDMSNIRVVTVVEPPFVFKNGSSYYGYSLDILDEIAKRLNFTYTIRDCLDGRYGSLSDNGSWTGCVGMVYRGEADLIIGALTVTLERDLVVDFTLPCFDFAGIHIIMKQEAIVTDLFYFKNVFTPVVWVCIGLVLITASILLVIFDHVSPCYRGDQKQRDMKRISTVKDSFWFAVGSLTLSDGGESPRCFSSRVMVAGFWFFCFIVMSTFTANLAALLTTNRMTVSVSSLEDLSKQTDIKFSVVEDSATMTYFESMALIEEDFHEIWKQMAYDTDEYNQNYEVWEYPVSEEFSTLWTKIKENEMLRDTEEAFERISKGNFAFITESPIVKYYLAKDCTLTSVGEQFSVRPYAMALREESSYTDKLSSVLLDLQSERIFEELKRKWWDSESAGCETVDANSGMTMKNLAGNFIVASIGIVGGFFMLVLELCFTKIRDSYKLRKRFFDIRRIWNTRGQTG